MRIELALLILLLSTNASPGIAATGHAICGNPPPVANESLKAEIAGKAKLLSRYIGGGEISGRIEEAQTEIFSKYPDAERSRSNAYLDYMLCILLMDDKRMTTPEKLDELRKNRAAIHNSTATNTITNSPGSIIGNSNNNSPNIRIDGK